MWGYDTMSYRMIVSGVSCLSQQIGHFFGETISANPSSRAQKMLSWKEHVLCKMRTSVQNHSAYLKGYAWLCVCLWSQHSQGAETDRSQELTVQPPSLKQPASCSVGDPVSGQAAGEQYRKQPATLLCLLHAHTHMLAPQPHPQHTHMHTHIQIKFLKLVSPQILNWAFHHC